jgi:glycosyltransferase involved in cell wall biosynthesis
MKLLNVIPSMDPRSGGPCQGIRNSMPELLALGVHQSIVCLDLPDAPFLDELLVPIHSLGPAHTSWAFQPSIRTWLEKHLPYFDAVIVHGLWQYPSYAVYAAMRHLLRTQPDTPLPRVYIMAHGMLDPYFQNAPERRLKALRNRIYWKWFQQRIINDADGILFTCEEELLLARTTFPGYRPKKEHNVGYGIVPPPAATPEQTQSFRSKLTELLPNQTYWLFLSRIHHKKGVDLLIRAYAELAKSSKLKAHSSQLPALVIAGPLDSAYAREMQALAQQLLPTLPNLLTPRSSLLAPSPPSIHFPGMLSGDAKWGAFYGCEAFVLPSHQENFGIAVVEALACGKPVLISNQVNIWREIEAAGAGWVAPDTLEGTMSLLTQALHDTSTVSRQERAREVYATCFSVGPAIRKLTQAINAKP